MSPIHLSINQKETGKHIQELLAAHGYSVKDVQTAMGFEHPQAIYKWLSGKNLPSLDNMLILSKILHTSIEDILVVDGDIFIFRYFSLFFRYFRYCCWVHSFYYFSCITCSFLVDVIEENGFF